MLDLKAYYMLYRPGKGYCWVLVGMFFYICAPHLANIGRLQIKKWSFMALFQLVYERIQ